MIEIKQTKDRDAVMTVKKGTKHTTMILGIEMLIECLLDERKDMTIDDILDDVRRIYERDNQNVSNRKEVVK